MRRLLFYVLLAIGICAPLAASQAKEALPQVALELVAEGLGAPLLLVAPPDGSGRRLIGDQLGVVYVLDRDGRRLATPFIDLRDQLTPLLQAFDERGLLALAFHPGFVKNGLLYINYSARRRPQSPFNGKTAYTWRTSEFKVSAADANQVDRSTERVLLQLDWVNRKHNGGGLAFGPDGYLYEPCWIHPTEAEARGIASGDVVMVHNERGAVLCGAVVTERIIPGALSIDHGAKMDLATLHNRRIDRGGCINLIAPTPPEKYGAGKEIKIPEMNVSGYLAQIEKVDASDIVANTGLGDGATVPAHTG